MDKNEKEKVEDDLGLVVEHESEKPCRGLDQKENEEEVQMTENMTELVDDGSKNEDKTVMTKDPTILTHVKDSDVECSANSTPKNVVNDVIDKDIKSTNDVGEQHEAVTADEKTIDDNVSSGLCEAGGAEVYIPLKSATPISPSEFSDEPSPVPSNSPDTLNANNNAKFRQNQTTVIEPVKTVIVPRNLPVTQPVSEIKASLGKDTKGKSPKSYSAQRSERPARGSRGTRNDDDKGRAKEDADKGRAKEDADKGRAKEDADKAGLASKPEYKTKHFGRKDKSPSRDLAKDTGKKTEVFSKENRRSDNRKRDVATKEENEKKKSDIKQTKKTSNKSDTKVVGRKEGNKDKNEPIDKIASQTKPPPIEEIKEKEAAVDAKKKEEEDARIREEEEQKQAKEIETEVKERIRNKMKMREENLKAAGGRPDEDVFHKLDSSLKKNTAFIKKLKMMGDQNRDSLVNELKGLNLTKYIGEVASAIYEAKLKMSDVPLAISISSTLHQRFADFAPQLLQNFQKNLPQTPKKEEKDSQPVIFDSKVRVEIRLLSELIVHGIFTDKEGLPVLNILLSSILKSDRENHAHISIIISFVKHCGEDYAGLVPRKNRMLVEKFGLKLPTSEVFSSQVQSLYRNLLKDHYTILAKHLVRQHKDLQNREKQNRKILQTKGELSEERRKNLEEAQVIYQKLLVNTTNLSDLLDLEMPDLPEDEKLREERENDLIGMLGGMRSNGEFDFETSLWEDEETRTFHENLTDLRTIVPAILFKDNSKQVAPGDQNEEEIDKVESVELPEEELVNEGKDETIEETNELVDNLEVEVEEPVEPEEEEVTTINVNMKMQLDSFLQRLHTCVNREFIDSAAVEFVMTYNTKSNRKKLVKTLFSVPRTRLDLLSFYSRLVATLFPCMPDVATDLVDRLKGDFKYHVKKKDQINIESKIKTVRFLGELTKFKMCPKADTLQCLKILLSDFRHHNIDMTCALLEVCGRFLYRSADSYVRTNALLEQMMRKKTRLHLSDRYSTMVENAFFFCNPPDTQKAEIKIRPPMHQYIRKLLFKDLTKLTVEKTLRQIRKLPWSDPEIHAYTTKCLALVWNVKYSNIHCLANLVAGLVAYHDDAGIMVVDNVMEDIRLGMEINLAEFNQRRVSMLKYLGELYNYRMVESAVIFKTLYTLIKFGISLDGTPTPFDPPEHLFRIRLVCTLLDTCGQFFDRGSTKKKLDCFLVYFQQYILYKKSLAIWDADTRPFPMDVDNMLSDTLEALRPKMKMAATLEEASDEVLALQNEYVQKLAPVSTVATASYQPGQGLAPILESRETDPSGSNTLVEDDDDDSDIDFSDRMDRASTGGSQGQSLSQHQPETGVDYDDTDITLDSAGEDEDDDSVTLLNKRSRVINCQEDEDFTSAFDKMMAETNQHRNNEVIKVPQFDVSVPMHMKRNPKSFTFLQEDQLEDEEPDKTDMINFTLVVRKGNKQQFKGFEVPLTSHLVANLKNREQAELAEKQRVKQITLDITERQEEEEYQETMSQITRLSTVAVATPTRDRKPRFYHPKGAPDSDQIFNSTGNRKW
ncbi:regulator of nonsense transcripts 2-like [Antedon mediterranea]|uniref:regulator of nonsense transcripts 2-like n=1 Tax=Antedon mediterranea TaxID=105859 RepID=UPI003AF885C4